MAHLLCHMRDAPLPGHLAAAGVTGNLAQQHLKEGGFTAAIGTDQTDLLAWKNGEVGGFQ